MGRPKSEYPAIARWNTDRTARVSAEGEINQASRNRSRRTARRSSGNTIWSGRIGWRPEVKILAGQTKRQLIGNSETAKRCACVE